MFISNLQGDIMGKREFVLRILKVSGVLLVLFFIVFSLGLMNGSVHISSRDFINMCINVLTGKDMEWSACEVIVFHIRLPSRSG